MLTGIEPSKFSGSREAPAPSARHILRAPSGRIGEIERIYNIILIGQQ